MYRYIVIRVVELARERTKQRRHLKACLDVAVPAQDNCELLQHNRIFEPEPATL